jgi:ABC-2 type transport system ATP-binding protein
VTRNALLALGLVAAVLTTGAGTPTPTPEPGPLPDGVTVTEERVTVPGGPGEPGPVELDTSLYVPAATPAPAVLLAHGFGGSKASVDADARELAARGYVVLAWSARGFGASTGQIALNAPDAEVADASAPP